jgi:hypothetical protein
VCPSVDGRIKIKVLRLPVHCRTKPLLKIVTAIQNAPLPREKKQKQRAAHEEYKAPPMQQEPPRHKAPPMQSKPE